MLTRSIRTRVRARIPGLRPWIFTSAAVALLAFAARPARAGLMDPDLTVSISGPAQVTAGAKLTYSVRVANTAYHTQSCQVLRGGSVFCVPLTWGSDASNVAVRFTLPAGSTFDGTPTGGGGFTCTTLGGVATCTGGAVARDGFVILSVPATDTNTLGSSTATATVDPANSISERNDSNNDHTHALLTLAKPNLLAIETVSPSPFSTWQPVTFTINVQNQDAGPVIDGTIHVFTNLAAGLDSWSIGGGFTCNAPSQYGQPLVIHCFGGNMPAFSSAQLRIEVKLFDQSTAHGTPFTMYGTLDPGNAIPETDEFDNNFTATTVVN